MKLKNEISKKGFIILTVLLLAGFYLVLENVGERQIHRLPEEAKLCEGLDPNNTDAFTDCQIKMQAAAFKKSGHEFKEPNVNAHWRAVVNGQNLPVNTEISGRYVFLSRVEDYPVSRCAFRTIFTEMNVGKIRVVPNGEKSLIVCVSSVVPEPIIYYTEDWDLKEMTKDATALANDFRAMERPLTPETLEKLKQQFKGGELPQYPGPTNVYQTIEH